MSESHTVPVTIVLSENDLQRPTMLQQRYRSTSTLFHSHVKNSMHWSSVTRFTFRPCEVPFALVLCHRHVQTPTVLRAESIRQVQQVH